MLDVAADVPRGAYRTVGDILEYRAGIANPTASQREGVRRAIHVLAAAGKVETLRVGVSFDGNQHELAVLGQGDP